jgi:hypothetical protein
MKSKQPHPPNRKRDVKRVTLTNEQRKSLEKVIEQFIKKTFYFINSH